MGSVAHCLARVPGHCPRPWPLAAMWLGGRLRRRLRHCHWCRRVRAAGRVGYPSAVRALFDARLSWSMRRGLRPQSRAQRQSHSREALAAVSCHASLPLTPTARLTNAWCQQARGRSWRRHTGPSTARLRLWSVDADTPALPGAGCSVACTAHSSVQGAAAGSRGVTSTSAPCTQGTRRSVCPRCERAVGRPGGRLERARTLELTRDVRRWRAHNTIENRRQQRARQMSHPPRHRCLWHLWRVCARSGALLW